jgi:hypothetical protein
MSVRQWSLFLATEYFTTLLPVPLEPVTMVIQDALLLAVHAQVDDEATTLTLPLPPDAVNFFETGERL